MSVIIEELPEAISFSKNCIVFGLHSEDYVINEESKARIDIQLSDYLDADQTFTLSFVDESGILIATQFIAKNSPILGTNQVPTEVTAPLALLDYANSIADYLRENALFNTHYTVSVFVDSPDVILRFALKGNSNQIFYADTTPSMASIDGGVEYIPFSGEPNFKMLIDVYIKVEDDYKLATTLQALPDQSGDANIEISEILNGEIEAYVQSIQPTLANVIAISEMLTKYYIRLRDYYGSPPEIQTINNSITELRTKFGGQYEKDWVAEPDFFPTAFGSAKWLSHRPSKVTVHPDQAYYLSVFKTFGDYAISIEFFYRDGSSENAIAYESIGGTFKYIVTLDLGFDTLVALTSPSTPDEIYKYAISFDLVIPGSPSNSYVSKLTKEFVLDRTYYQNIRDYFFLNRYNCLEVLRATGVHSTELNTEREECMVAKCVSPNQLKGISHNYGHNSIMDVDGTSGLITSQEEINALIDFMHTDYIWLAEAGDPYTILHPLKVTNKKFTLTQDKRNINAISFTYQYANNPVDH